MSSKVPSLRQLEDNLNGSELLEWHANQTRQEIEWLDEGYMHPEGMTRAECRRRLRRRLRGIYEKADLLGFGVGQPDRPTNAE
jgi:hypothetical protein